MAPVAAVVPPSPTGGLGGSRDIRRLELGADPIYSYGSTAVAVKVRGDFSIELVAHVSEPARHWVRGAARRSWLAGWVIRQFVAPEVIAVSGQLRQQLDL